MSLTDDDKQWISEKLTGLEERWAKHWRVDNAEVSLHEQLDAILKSGHSNAVPAIKGTLQGLHELILMTRPAKDNGKAE